MQRESQILTSISTIFREQQRQREPDPMGLTWWFFPGLLIPSKPSSWTGKKGPNFFFPFSVSLTGKHCNCKPDLIGLVNLLIEGEESSQVYFLKISEAFLKTDCWKWFAWASSADGFLLPSGVCQCLLSGLWGAIPLEHRTREEHSMWLGGLPAKCSSVNYGNKWF